MWADIHQLIRNGIPISQIAKSYNLSRTHIYRHGKKEGWNFKNTSFIQRFFNLLRT